MYNFVYTNPPTSTIVLETSTDSAPPPCKADVQQQQHNVMQVYRTSVYEGRSTDKLRLTKKNYKITKKNLAKIESESKSLVGEPPHIITKDIAAAGVPPKEENVIRVSRYHAIDETVRIWNDFRPSPV